MATVDHLESLDLEERWRQRAARLTGLLLHPAVGRRHVVWVAVVVWMAGVSALLGDHFRLSKYVIVGLHSFYAVACFAGIFGVVFLARGVAGVGQQAAVYESVRGLSRWVYLLIYLLAGVRLGLFIYESSYPSSYNHAFRMTARPMDDFQFYLVCGVVPLWLARAIRARRHAPGD